MKTIANDQSYWKTFRDNFLTHSSAHYLRAVAQLLEQKGYARVTDVARQLEITKAAASQGVAILKSRGLVCEDEARMLSLTDTGRTLIAAIERNFAVLSAFFEQILDVPSEIARADACKMEHLLSPETAANLQGLLEAIMEDSERRASLVARLRDLASPLNKGGWEG
ncbi:metal-dependent transcriptional regulator [bacterium]|nr:metal-dependent transcriptional regulator [bacterium]